MEELQPLFARAVAELAERMYAIADDQWVLPTPDTDWDVRTLVNHLVNECLWAPPLLAGSTIAEVGGRFDGDLLGDDPRTAWDRASAEAVVAVSDGGMAERTVHVSFGDIPAAEYVSQLVSDLVVHSWDLARAIGVDESLDTELVDWVLSYLRPNVESAAGVFGPEIEVPACADPQTMLLGLTGRRR